MENRPPVPDYLRSWLPTAEDYDSPIYLPLVGVLDSKPAWRHFEPLLASHGYSICYYPEKREPSMPKADLDAAGDPFHPTATGPFIHSISEKYDLYFRDSNRYQTFNPRLSFAYDDLNRMVIIKALDSTNDSDCLELEIVKYLNSPALRSSPKNHTIPILKVIESEGWNFLIMPAWNATCSPYFVWQVDDYFNMAIQSLEGLAFMHEHGVAHRDISMNNILFNQDGTLLTGGWMVQPILSTWDARLAFIDFGLSRKFTPGSDQSTWVASESWGTRTHMAPEVENAEETALSYQVLPADVHALGQVWKKWMAWEARNIPMLAKNPDLQHLAVPTYPYYVLVQHVPQFMQLIEQMIHSDPSRRPTAASALSQFGAMRETVPAQIRFAPADGYPAGLT